MLLAPIPATETERQNALERSGILTATETEQLERFVFLAQHWFDAAIAMISLSDGDRQYFPAVSGFPVTEAPRSTSFCGHMTASGQPLIVEDATQDQRFCDNPAVIGAPFVRSYAGHPIAFGGHVLGGLCVADSAVRECSDRDCTVLAKLAEAAGREIELLHQTTQDALTGLLNRNGLQQAGEKMIAAAERHAMAITSDRSAAKVTALFLDLDGFKSINDLNSHDVGDLALIDFSTLLQNVNREGSSCVSRKSGDEFIVLMGNADRAAAQKMLQRFDQTLAIYNAQESRYQLRYSVGIAEWRKGRSLEALIAEADAAMYADKQQRKAS